MLAGTCYARDRRRDCNAANRPPPPAPTTDRKNKRHFRAPPAARPPSPTRWPPRLPGGAGAGPSPRGLDTRRWRGAGRAQRGPTRGRRRAAQCANAGGRDGHEGSGTPQTPRDCAPGDDETTRDVVRLRRPQRTGRGEYEPGPSGAGRPRAAEGGECFC